MLMVIERHKNAKYFDLKFTEKQISKSRGKKLTQSHISAILAENTYFFLCF